MTDSEIIKEIKDRWRLGLDAVEEENNEMLDDLNFLNGDQWPKDLAAQRQVDGRPCLVINKVPNFGDQVIGDIRQNSPTIKVKPVDSNSDPETAEILTGLIRNIEVQSNAEVAYDTAAESTVYMGKGAFRVVTEYSEDDTFEQDIRIRRIKNPFTVVWDPNAQEFDKSDAKWCFVTEKMSKEEFEELYPDASAAPFDAKTKDTDWADKKNIRIVEYFKREDEVKKLYLLKDPITGTEKTLDEKLDGWDVVKSRDVTSHKITWYKANGTEILEGPTEWPGRYIPIVSVFGKELNIENKTVYRGITRFAKDPQRLYNYARSTSAETMALAPRAPYLISAKMIGQYQTYWDNAHKRNFPYLPFEADPNLQGIIPQRTSPIQVNTGIQAEILVSDQELHDTTGLQQASLGQKSNEKSGRAIMARQREGDVANYTYYDNLARALKYCGKVLLDLIPRIYDTPRVVRILGEDTKEQFVPVNQPVFNRQGESRIFDLTTGKYDVIVTIGPSYSTQREEAADSMMQFLQAFPAAGPLIGDLVAKNMDWPGASEIEKRLKAMIPPQVLGAEQGSPPPTQQGPGTPQGGPPDPRMMLTQAQLEGQLIKNRTAAHQQAMSEMGLNESRTTQKQ
jgi:hypothetical protein